MDLKELYSVQHSKASEKTVYLNQRLFNTYNRIVQRVLNKNISGVNIDLGSGDEGFTKYLNKIGIESFPYDYPFFDMEKDMFNHIDNSIDFVTLNAVIEHIQKPEHIFSEIRRVLKTDGLVFIRTPNWQIDFKNFYNDPTHIKPYTPQTVKNFLTLFGFDVIFLEPGLIEKSWFWWTLPDSVKWKCASFIKGGTKSIIAIARKRQLEYK
jgi:SAM-dependent methyltransferase